MIRKHTFFFCSGTLYGVTLRLTVFSSPCRANKKTRYRIICFISYLVLSVHHINSNSVSGPLKCIFIKMEILKCIWLLTPRIRLLPICWRAMAPVSLLSWTNINKRGSTKQIGLVFRGVCLCYVKIVFNWIYISYRGRLPFSSSLVVIEVILHLLFSIYLSSIEVILHYLCYLFSITSGSGLSSLTENKTC